MIKVTVKVEGMACPMCEAHVNDAVRRFCGAGKVVSSHKKGTCEFSVETAPDEAGLKAAIEEMGYTVHGIEMEEEKKKGFSLFRK